MDWEEALRARALADAAVMAACGGVSWDVRPQDKPLPWLVLSLVSDPRPQDLKDFVSRRESRVQVDAWAESASAAKALRQAAQAALVPAGDFEGIGFGRGLVELGRRTAADTGTGFVHRDSFDLMVWHD
jgi:hypothetical protein